MAYVSETLTALERAQRLGKIVRFVYVPKSTERPTAKVGTVAELSGTHVLLNDLFHDGAPRSCILDRIESVEY